MLNDTIAKIAARLPDGPALLRSAVAVAAGALALWALGIAVTLVLAALVGGLAVAAGIAAVGLVAELLARRTREVATPGPDDSLRDAPIRCAD